MGKFRGGNSVPYPSPERAANLGHDSAATKIFRQGAKRMFYRQTAQTAERRHPCRQSQIGEAALLKSKSVKT
jgi:hypothetical protein